MRNVSRRLNQAGETLVEVLVALAALGITLGSCAVIVSRSTQSMQMTQENTAALGIAQGQIERMKQYIGLDPTQLTNATSTMRLASTVGFCMSSDAANTVQTGTACVRDIQEYQIANRITPDTNGSYILTSDVQYTALSSSVSRVTLTYRMYP